MATNFSNRFEIYFFKKCQFKLPTFSILYGNCTLAFLIFVGFSNFCFSQCPTLEETTKIIDDRNPEDLIHLIDNWQKCSNDNDTLLSLAYHNLGVVYYSNFFATNEQSYIYEAIKAFDKALKIREKILPKNAFLKGKNHFNLGALYLKIKNYKRSDSHLKNALAIFSINNNNQPKRELNAALELIKLYAEIGDYAKCLDYFKIALNIAKDSKDPKLIGRTYTTYSNRSRGMKKYSKSLDAAKNAISIYQNQFEYPEGLAYNYLNAGLALFEMKRFNEALPYLNESLAIFKKLEDLNFIWSILNNLGQLHTKIKNYEQALIYLQKSLKIANDYNVDDYLATNFHNIGEVYFDQRDYENAINYFQRAIIHAVEGFENSDITISPNIESIDLTTEKSHFLEILSKKAACFKGLAEQKNKERKLILALDNYLLASQLIDQMREEFTGQGSKLHWLEEAYPLLENAIEVSLELYEITGNKSYQEAILGFMEKNKAILLLESINSAKDVYFADIPDSLLFQQSQLKNEIAGLQRNLLELQKKDEIQNSDSTLLATEKELAELKIKLSDLEESLKENFSGFGQLSKIHTSNLDYLRNTILTNNQALIEFFVGDSTTYITTVSKEHFLVNAVPTKGLRQHASDLLYVIHPSRQHKTGSKEFFQKFTQSAYLLYDLLLKKPLSEIKNTDQLIIVPDDIISYLPFDILLQDEVNLDKVNFSPEQLNYLIKDYSITYAYSGTVLADLLAEEQKSDSSPSFLGFAPGFGGTQSSESEGRACNFENPPPLKNNQPEVQEIYAILGGKTMLGNSASKTKFLEMASEYTILHLATHACADAENSDRNRIFFSDDHLYNHELSNLKLKADMVVLSACETGIGEFKRGEGVMSLARGFAYSGTPSITMSLWSVDDKSTSELMLSYYKHLNDKMPKDLALRKAKLDYLNSQEDLYKLHPLFWAAFVHYGDTTPLFRSNYWGWYIGGIVLIFLTLILFRYFRK